MDDLPLNKIQISGPTLASMIQRFLSSPGDVDGLLFGRVTQITPVSFSDDTPTTSSSAATVPSDSPTIVAIVTSFICLNSNCSFYEASGDISTVSLQRILSSFSDQSINRSLLGWFSGRRKTPIRPSLRESSVTSSLSSDIQFSLPVENSPKSYTFPPCLFFLFTTPIQDQLIHTHEYRAYQFRYPTDTFEPKTLDVVNIGPAFRGHYGSFSPNSPFPAIQFKFSASNSSMADDEKVDKESLKDMKQLHNDHKELEMLAEGFDISRLNKLMGPEAAHYTAEIDHLYETMLAKLNGLAKLVEKSSIKVLEQENLNSKLRYKVAGME